MRSIVRVTTVAAVAAITWSTVSAAGRQTAPPQSGIYLVGAKADELARLRGSAADVQQHTSAAVMFGGRGSMSGELAGTSADFRTTQASPEFMFYLSPPPANGRQAPPPDPMAAMAQMAGMMGGDSMPPTAKSAEEFELIKLIIKDNKRYADLGTPGKRLHSKQALPVVVERVSQGVYKLHAKDALGPGEYAFLFVATQGMSNTMWDFGIDAKK